jgi:transcriptional regulator with XRE-family HTH domain
MGIEFLDDEIQKDFESIDPLKKFQAKRRFEFADQLRRTLKDKGLTQKAFAVLLKKEESEISKWLSGFHNFTKDTESLIEYFLKTELTVLKDSIKPDVIYYFAMSEEHKNNAIKIKPNQKLSELEICLTIPSEENSQTLVSATEN